MILILINLQSITFMTPIKNLIKKRRSFQKRNHLIRRILQNLYKNYSSLNKKTIKSYAKTLNTSIDNTII